MGGDCSDCGATKRETMVLGFACQHERCPVLSEECTHVSDVQRDTRAAFDAWYSNQFNATAPRIIEQTDHASDFWQCWLAATQSATPEAEPRFRFGEWLYSEGEFNRLLANGDAFIAGDGARYLKFDRMGQDVWVREFKEDVECKRRMERAALTLSKLRQCNTPCGESPGTCECIDILDAAFRSEAAIARPPAAQQEQT